MEECSMDPVEKDCSHSMTSKHRFLSALYGGRVDRPATGSAVSMVTVELMSQVGVYFPDAHLDPEKMAVLAAAGHEILGFDNIMPYFSVINEAEALGCSVEWGTRDSMPEIKTRPFNINEDVPVPDDFLEKPSIRVLLDCIRILHEKYGDRVSITGKAFGPWTLSYNLFGVDEFLIATVLQPERVKEILAQLKEVTVMFGKAQIEAGADSLSIPDHATRDLCSPEAYRDFLLPIHRELRIRLGCPLILHLCGHSLDRIPYIAETGMACFHYDTRVNAQDARRATGNKVSLMGGVNNPTTLLHGAPEDVREEVRQAIEAGIEIIGPECAVPLGTPVRNLKAITDEVRRQTGA